MLFKRNPATNARSLRPMLAKYLHCDITIDETFIWNFRQRADYFHASNPNYKEFSMVEAQLLLDKNTISEEEHRVLDNPITRLNFNEILLKIMFEDCSTREALTHVRPYKKEMRMFDFRIKLKQNNHPGALVYTTNMGRSNTIRYSDVICIDM